MSNTKNTSVTKSTVANSENAIVKNLTREEIAKAQETAQTRILEFDDAFKKATEKRDDITVTKVTTKNNLNIKTKNASAEICRKEKFTVIYTCRCTDLNERDKILKSFNDTKDIHTCKTSKYLDSKETRIELIIESNKVDKKFIDSIVNACESLKAQRVALKKKVK